MIKAESPWFQGSQTCAQSSFFNGNILTNINKRNNGLESHFFQIDNYIIDLGNHQWVLKLLGQSLMGNVTMEGSDWCQGQAEFLISLDITVNWGKLITCLMMWYGGEYLTFPMKFCVWRFKSESNQACTTGYQLKMSIGDGAGELYTMRKPHAKSEVILQVRSFGIFNKKWPWKRREGGGQWKLLL